MRISVGRRMVIVASLVASSIATVRPAGAAEQEAVLRVETTPTLGCVIEHRDDPLLSFFATTFAGVDGAAVSAAACGTFVAVGGQLYGPEHTPGMFAGNSDVLAPEVRPAAPAVFTPIAQSAVTGTGTERDPYQVVTRVKAGRTGVEVVQTDRWTTTDETVETRIDVFNRSRHRRTVSLYRAGDCQAGAYSSFGSVGLGRAACLVATQDGPGHDMARRVPGDAIVELQGNASTAVVDIHGHDGLGAALEGPMMSGVRLRPVCTRCDSDAADRSVALGWRLRIDARGSLTVRTSTTISSSDARPISTVEAHLSAPGDDTISATLTSGGRALRHQVLRFLRDGTEVCRAVTDRSGAARCLAPPPMLIGDPAASLLAASPTVDVMFDGDLDTRPSNTWVELGAAPADPRTLPAAGGCTPTNAAVLAGFVPGAASIVLMFAEASCPSVRYAFYSDSGAFVGAAPGSGANRLVLEFTSFGPVTGRLVLSRFRQLGVELYSAVVTAVSPGKAIG